MPITDKVPQINQSELPRYINDQREFIAGSVRGVLTRDDHYQIWSYNTLILEVNRTKVTYFDSSTYSKTTSKLQNLLKSLFFTEGV